MQLTSEQIANLEKLKNGEYPLYAKLKALALLAVARGYLIKDIADIIDVTPQTIYNWFNSYFDDGIDALCKSNGSGRLSHVDSAQIDDYLRQSPKDFGISRQRWSLASLAKVVPCLEGYSRYGVQLVLKRLGYSYNGTWKRA